MKPVKKGTLVIRGNIIQLQNILQENSSRAQIYGLTMKMSNDEDKSEPNPAKGTGKGKNKKKK
ncbi:MAG: hypothetical protein ACUZ8H_01440 [Candidatus Anammoxibacter sp.]